MCCDRLSSRFEGVDSGIWDARGKVRADVGSVVYICIQSLSLHISVADTLIYCILQ